MFDDGFDKTCIRKVLADELRLDGTKRSSGGSNLQTVWESLLQAARLNFIWLQTKKEIIGLKSKP